MVICLIHKSSLSEIRYVVGGGSEKGPSRKLIIIISVSWRVIDGRKPYSDPGR